jgi:glycosyltransferase involved in cell wall biosynthesis
MKIALLEITTTVSYGGIQTAMWQLAIALTDSGHRVTVFGGDGALRPELFGRKVDVQTFPFKPREQVLPLGSRFQRVVERLSFSRSARAAVIAGGFDWIILNKPFDFFWPWIMPRGSKTRFAYMSNGTDFIAFDRIMQRRIDPMLCCSYFNAWQLRTRFRHRLPTVIYNGVDTDRFTPDGDVPGLRASMHVPEDAVVFGFVGRLVGWKGLKILLQALVEPCLREVPLRLLVVGDGPQRSELARLSDELGIGDRVSFQPAMPHAAVAGCYRAIDVGVFPSVGDEAFGITIAEAMSCGRPVVATYIGGIPEVVGNEGTCGLLVPPGNPHELAKAMRALALDPQRRRKMGDAARARIQQNYTWSLSCSRLIRALEAAPTAKQ